MPPDRIIAMCKDLFDYPLATGDPEQKTIVFCVRDSHADAVAIEMGNLYADWCKQEGRRPVEGYAFKCTGLSQGSKLLADFRGSAKRLFVPTGVFHVRRGQSSLTEARKGSESGRNPGQQYP